MSKQDLREQAIQKKIIKDIPFEYRDKENLINSYKEIGYTEDEALKAANEVSKLDQTFKNI